MIAFAAREDLKADFCPIFNRIVNLTLLLDLVGIGLTGCYAPIECSEDDKEKENFAEDLRKSMEIYPLKVNTSLSLVISTAQLEQMPKNGR